jgi:hypothetical protein
MIWTPEKVALLRECAARGMMFKEAAHVIGITAGAAHIKAHRLGISFGRHNARYDDAMERWKPLIGPMKAALRADVEKIINGSA